MHRLQYTLQYFYFYFYYPGCTGFDTLCPISILLSSNSHQEGSISTHESFLTVTTLGKDAVCAGLPPTTANHHQSPPTAINHHQPPPPLPPPGPQVKKPCAAGCEERGNCNSEEGRCECPLGWVGPACEKNLMPNCRYIGAHTNGVLQYYTSRMHAAGVLQYYIPRMHVARARRWMVYCTPRMHAARAGRGCPRGVRRIMNFESSN